LLLYYITSHFGLKFLHSLCQPECVEEVSLKHVPKRVASDFTLVSIVNHERGRVSTTFRAWERICQVLPTITPIMSFWKHSKFW